mmetsp:Transcript_3301/g.8559  ORF Transcript_3301/g.8559 Transcript_3301/m.8559 type:complete len:115 (-) Transcript_3301:318-662(-)
MAGMSKMTRGGLATACLSCWLLTSASSLPLAQGAFGGTLSTAMQGEEIAQTPHFVTALIFLGGLTANGVFAYSGFGASEPKGKISGRKAHAYAGAALAAVVLAHAGTGIAGLLK